MNSKVKLFLLSGLVLISSVSFGQIASSTIHGVTSGGVVVPVAVENDGRVKSNQTAPYTNGSADAQALLDSDNNILVNINKDTRRKAVKTTSNHLAGSTPQTLTLISDVTDVSIVLSENGTMWVKVGANDAGVDNGALVTSSILVENCASDTVISYYASPSVKFSVVQE